MKPGATAWRLLGAAAGGAAAAGGLYALGRGQVALGLVLVLAALVSWTATFARAPWLVDGAPPPLPPLPRAVEWSLAAVVLAVGAFFRLYLLPDVPWGMSIDGAAYALKALDFYRGAPYEPLWLSRETMYMYVMAGVMKVFGHGLLSVRLTSALFGILAMPFCYLAAKEILGSRAALAATAILSTSIYAVTFSRSDWRVIEMPLFVFAALWGLLRALDTGRLRWWAFTGAMVGLGLNTYDSFRLIAAGAFVAAAVEVRTLPGWKKRLSALAVLGVFTAVFFGPLGIYSLTHWQDFSARARAVSIFEHVQKSHSIRPLLNNVAGTVMTFLDRSFGDFVDNQHALLSPVEGFLYLGGLSVILGNLRARRIRVLFLLFVFGLVPPVLTWPNAQRLMGSVPLTAIMGGLFLTGVWILMSGTRARLAAPLLVAGTLVAAGVYSYGYLLGPRRQIIWGFAPEAVAIAQYVRPFRDTAYVIVEEPTNKGQMDFFNYEPGTDPLKSRFPSFSQKRHVPIRETLERPACLILEDRPENRSLVPILQRFYPDLTVEEIRNHYDPNRSVGFAVHVPLATLNAAHGLRAEYFAGPKPSGPPLLVRRDAALPAANVPAGARSAVWETQFWAEDVGEYTFRVGREVPVALEIGGQPVRVVDGEGRILLTNGFHRLRLVANGDPSRVLLADGDGRPYLTDSLFTTQDIPLSLTGRPAIAEESVWELVWRTGKHGKGPGEFFRPMNVALDGKGFVYVGDADNRRIVKLGSDGAFAAEWGRLGNGPGALEHEMGLGVSGDELIVSDRWNDRVQVWTLTGEFRDVRVPRDAIRSPRGVAVLPGGDFLATSPGQGQIRRFARDGTPRGGWGSVGTGPGQFVEPVGLAVDAASNVYVADAGKHTMQKFDLAGNLLLEWFDVGIMWESYCAVDPAGRVHVTAPDENTVHTYTAQGVRIVRGTRANRHRPFAVDLNHPMGLTFDARGDLVLTSTWGDEVMKFRAAAPAAR